MGRKARNKRINYKLWNIKLYFSPKWSRPQLNFGWENNINRRRPSSLFHATTQTSVQFFGRERSLHTLQKKTIFRVSIFGKHLHIFLFFLHRTLISKLLSLDEGCWVFFHLGFPGEKYLCYCFVLCLSSSDPIDKCN